MKRETGRLIHGTISRMKRRNISLNKRRVIQLLSLFLISFLIIGVFAVNTKASSNADRAQKYKYYTQIRIEYGDSLWSIAEQYMDRTEYNRASYIAEIKSINHIKDNDFIQEGKNLIIPYYSYEIKE